MVIHGKNKDTQMIKWSVAKLVERYKVAEDVMSLRFSVPNLPERFAGQHYDIKLTSSDGYIAERSYSVANVPEEKDIIEFGVQYLEDGEVSPYLHAMEVGDEIEIRGPIGGHFIWEPRYEERLILIGGGSGFVPLMSILRQYVLTRDVHKIEVKIFISSHTISKILYYDELLDISSKFKEIDLNITLTDEKPEDWKGFLGRVNKEMLSSVLDNKIPSRVYICGSNGFVEAVSKEALSFGIDSSSIKTERFG